MKEWDVKKKKNKNKNGTTIYFVLTLVQDIIVCALYLISASVKYDMSTVLSLGFLGGSVVKNLPADAGDETDSGLIPGLGRSPGGGNGNVLQYSRLGNPMDRGAWQTTVHGVIKSQT